MKLTSVNLVLLLLFVGLYLSACNNLEKDIVKPNDTSAEGYEADVVTAWNDFYIETNDHIQGFRPPISARAMAYIGLSAYEAAAPGMSNHQSIASRYPLPDFPVASKTDKYHWGEAVNEAMYRGMNHYVSRLMTKTDQAKRDSIYKAFNTLFKTQCDSSTFVRSKKFGTDVAISFLRYSFSDGQELIPFNNKPGNYIPIPGIDKWRSTLPDTLRALTPFWGAVRTYAITDADRTMIPPVAFSQEKTSAFYKEALEVHNAVKNATKEDIWIAEYWSDDASTFTMDAAARWLSIANQSLKLKKSNLEKALVVTAKIGVVLHDASVACWGNKFKYNLLRPVSYIQENIDPKWQTLLRDPTKKAGQQIGITPQHPSYPSGHSVFGQAAAEVLIAELGDKINLTDRSGQGRPYAKYYDMRPRTFKTFTAMANENAFSRIKLGVHYRMDCEQGLVLGKKVGQRINSLNWKKTAL